VSKKGSNDVNVFFYPANIQKNRQSETLAYPIPSNPLLKIYITLYTDSNEYGENGKTIVCGLSVIYFYLILRMNIDTNEYHLTSLNYSLRLTLRIRNRMYHKS